MSAVPESSAATAAATRASSDGSGEGLLEVTNLVKHFPIKSGILIDRQVGAGGGS